MMRNRRVNLRKGRTALLSTVSDNGTTETPNFPEKVQVLGKFIHLDDIRLQKDEMWEVLEED